MSNDIKKMLIEDVMTKDVITVQENDAVSVFKDYFSARRIHHLVVENDKGHISGMISNSDISKVLSWAFDNKITAEQLMSKNVETIESQDSVKKALKVFLKNEIRALPVVDSENNVIGIITPYDILRKV